jgi:plasminogen
MPPASTFSSRIYFRNPTPDQRTGAWCFVGAKNDTTWEYCDVEDCRECGTPSLRMSDYQGQIAVTRSKRPCLPWADREEELMKHNLSSYYSEKNYCRNDLSFGDSRETAWCFVEGNSTSDFEYCDIPDCMEEVEEDLPDAVAVSETCGSLSVQQANYRGAINVTASGLTCQAWSSQVPHRHKNTPDFRPNDGLDGNACRNPDRSEGGAWCYTTNSSILWEYCSVPTCP